MIRPMRSADHDDVERIIGDFGAAASRAQRGGLDGCEISVLGHLGGQFRSPAVNRRTDGYGGRHDEDFLIRIAPVAQIGERRGCVRRRFDNSLSGL